MSDERKAISFILSDTYNLGFTTKMAHKDGWPLKGISQQVQGRYI
jgi:hypothetical protein